MLNMKYNVLKANLLDQQFNDYLSNVRFPLLDYVAIGVQDTVHKKSTSLMSNTDWQNEFAYQNYAAYDPVRLTALHSSCNFFTFDQVICTNNSAKEVMLQRRRHGIESGFVLLERSLGYNYMITLGTGYKNFNAAKYYSENKQSLLKIAADLKYLIDPFIKNYKI